MNKDNKNSELDTTDKKLHISDVMCSVLSLDNIEMFIKEYNDRMKVIFGVDNWIQHYENEHKCKLEDFIGKTWEETKDILSYIDRDWEEYKAIAYNAFGLGEVAEHKTQIELLTFKITKKCQTKHKTAILPRCC